MRLALLVALAIPFSACDDGTSGLNLGIALDAGQDLQTPPDMARQPDRAATDHPPLPIVAPLHNVVVAAPEIYTVVWQGHEADGHQANEFLNWLLTSDYWTGSVAEYGVGAGTAKGIIVLNSAAPATIDDAQVAALVNSIVAGTAGATNGSGAPLGAVTATQNKTSFAFLIPDGTQSSQLAGDNGGCNAFDGYHSEAKVGGDSGYYVPYSVNLYCYGGFKSLSFTLSHETAESATDPHPFTAESWQAPDQPQGGEIGDLCVSLSRVYDVTVPLDGGGMGNESYVVTRLYSTATAAIGTNDPCVPAEPGHPYFGVALDQSDIEIDTDVNGDGFTTVKIEPFAFGDVGYIGWEIDYAEDSIAVSPGTGNSVAGRTYSVTFTTNANKKMTATGSYPITISSAAQDGSQNLWFGQVIVR